ncbi:MAG: hypothetical protein Q9213_005637 [Squamulea squamosa]
MSTTSPSIASPPKAPPSRTWIPTSKPISLLPTSTARLYHNFHPILLLSLFYLSFSALVANPISTLYRLLFPLAGFQMLFCVLCLPIARAGALPRIMSRERRAKPGAKKMREVGVVWEKVVPSILATLLTLLLATPLITVMIILFGIANGRNGPLQSSLERTLDGQQDD